MARALKPKVFGRCLLWGTTLAALAVACANPSNDYDAFQTRTNGVRGVEPMSPLAHDGGTACTTAPAGEPPDFSKTGLPNADGVYFGTCLANLSECDLEKTLRFRVEFTGTSTGMVTLKSTSLLIGATSTSQTVGDPYSATGMLRPDGTYDVIFTSGVVPGSANSISQRDISLVNSDFRGTFLSASSACAELDGTIEVKGVSVIDLGTPGDICLFTKVASETEQVVRKLEDFHCP